MRRISIVLSMLLASVLFSAVPLLAAGEMMEQGGQPEQSMQKDECLLVARNCGDEVDSIQQRIDKLNAEIAKGAAVYTPEELQTLKNKLNDAYEKMNNMYETY